MKSKRTLRFRELYNRLPPPIRERADDAYRLFKRDPFHPSLQFKRISAPSTLPPVYSVRIGLGYRALGLRTADDTVEWFWIGSHAEYDKLV